MDNLSIRDLLLLTCMGSFIACAPGAETIPPLQFGNFFRTQWNGIAINHFGRIGPLGQLINARRDATDGVSCRHSSRFPLLRLPAGRPHYCVEVRPQLGGPPDEHR